MIPGKLYKTQVTGSHALFGSRTPLFSEREEDFILCEIHHEEIVMFVRESPRKRPDGTGFLKVIYGDMVGLVPTKRLELLPIATEEVSIVTLLGSGACQSSAHGLKGSKGSCVGCCVLSNICALESQGSTCLLSVNVRSHEDELPTVDIGLLFNHGLQG